jgi:hypothetical protein
MRNLRPPPRLACLAGLAMLSLAAAPSDARACGYHDDVSVARGALNWTYPDALYVIGAISAAVAEKRLLHESVAPDLFGSPYRATVKALEQIAGSLPAARDVAPSPFSLVLVESMLWTRFDGGAEWHMQPHVVGPQVGDLIVVSGEVVIRAVASGGLSIGEAHDRGLVRLYGNETQIARFLDAFKGVGGGHRLGSHDQAHDRRNLSLRPAAMQ